MINFEYSLDNLLEMIKDNTELVHKQITIQNPEKWSGLKNEQDKKDFFNVVSFVKYLDSLGSPWLKHCKYDEQYLALYYSLENASNRGEFPISLEINSTKKGRVYSVKDSGNGFQVKKLLKKVRSGQKHSDNRGTGVPIMDSCPAVVTYNEKGNKCYILIKHDKD